MAKNWGTISELLFKIDKDFEYKALTSSELRLEALLMDPKLSEGLRNAFIRSRQSHINNRIRRINELLPTLKIEYTKEDIEGLMEFLKLKEEMNERKEI